MEILNVPQGEFKISRYPPRENELLRAWDAADEYLLSYFYTEVAKKVFLNLLIINDSFGALSTALAKYKTTVWTDSFLATRAITENFAKNDLSTDKLKIKKSIESVAGRYDYILIKIPKSLALLEEQLARIKPYLSSTTKMIGVGMVKSIHTSTLKLFEKYIGDTKTSLAKKKARLIFPQVDTSIQSIKSPYPKSYVLEGTEYTIINHANVFSREKLDIGTRFFLQHIPTADKYKTIIDLACGNGVIGLIAAKKNAAAEILFIDESFMAVESARVNFKNAINLSNKAQFEVSNGLLDVDKNSADLILNNPPFHQNNAIGDKVAWQMFTHSFDVLNKNGELWVVGNRHLAYHAKLKKIFFNCETVAANKKFVILKSIKK